MSTNKSVKVTAGGKFKYISAADLAINDAAQRNSIDMNRVARIAAHFDPAKLGVLTVNQTEDGALHIVDGAHRWQVAVAVHGDNTLLPCLVYEGLTSEEEAELFIGLDTRRAINPFDRFKVCVTAGHQREVDIDEIVRSYGLRVVQKSGQVCCPNTLIKIYNFGGRELVARVMKIATSAFGTSGVTQPMLEGLYQMLGRYPDFSDDEMLVKKLSSVLGGYVGVYNGAQKLRLNTGESLGESFCRAIVSTYNSGSRGKKLAAW